MSKTCLDPTCDEYVAECRRTNANRMHRPDCRLYGYSRQSHECDCCYKAWDGHEAIDCGGIRCTIPAHVR